jgi:hypothetical protein
LKSRTILSASFVAFGLGLSSLASAQPTTQEKALASRLFDDASKALAAGKTDEACPKYAESERLDPELGTLLHLGECYAKQNKTASAWTSFKEANDIATQRSDPRAPKIRERVVALEKNLANLVIVVAANEPQALEVRQDGAVVGRAGWGTAIPVDPGEHKISATAPGAKPREVKLTVPDKAQTLTVNLPPIELLPAEAQPETPPSNAATLTSSSSAQTSASADHSRSWFSEHQRTLGLVIGGVGVVGIGVGSAFGLMAKSTYDKSDPHCNGDHCDSTGHDFRESALGKATVSDVTFGVGAAALIGGAILFLTAPKASAQSAVVTPIIGPNLALISVRRSF